MDRALRPIDSRADPLEFAAAFPGMAMLITVRGWRVALAEPLVEIDDHRELPELGGLIDWRGHPLDGAPFAGGVAGLLTDACAADFLRLPAEEPAPAPIPTPAVCLGLFDTAACWSPDGQMWVVAADLPGSKEPPEARLDRWSARADLAAEPPAVVEPPPGEAVPTLARRSHARAVAQVLEWIAAGDLYQLNLTFHLSTPWRGGGPALARRLWAASPGAAHAAWLRLPDGTEVASVSPETFLRTDGDRVVVRPIKGTRPRRPAPSDDETQAKELLGSDKDLAEHVMIVDLERNDLGRVCVTGSVRVPELAALEAHPTVWHLTSTVEGRLRPEVGLGDLVEATFPSGSVTGAPKRMAVARIRRIEPRARGAYCGAIGLVTRGMVDLSVAIRTAVLRDGLAVYGTGGGIVADSDPDEEWQEAVDKAAPFLTATNTRLSGGLRP